MHRGKVDPGVSELPRGNELSWDDVNRPLEKSEDKDCLGTLMHFTIRIDKYF